MASTAGGHPRYKMKVMIDRPRRVVEVERMYKYAHNGLIRLWKDCIRAFVRELSNHIMIDTGMSYASILPLAATVRIREEIEAGMIGLGSPKSGFKNLTGNFASNNARFKSKTLGEQLGREAFTIKFGTPHNPELTFTFHLVVFQYYLHEEYRGGNYVSSNWRSIPKAQAAFLETWDAGIKSGEYINGRILLEVLTGGPLGQMILTTEGI